MLVTIGNHPALGRINSHWHNHLVNFTFGIGRGCFFLGEHGVFIRHLLGYLRKHVVKIFSSFSHNQCIFGNQPIHQKPRVGISGGGHWMMTHMFHPACDGDIESAQGNFRGGGCNRSHSSGAHAIHRGASALFRESCQDGRGPPKGEPLIFFLGGGTP